jgi:signal peptide peptidase SppA
MRFPYLLQYCMRTPWAMEPSAMATYAAILARAYALRGDAGGAGPDAAVTRVPMSATPGRGGTPAGGSIAVIPVRGAIVQRASQLGPCEGGTGAQEIGAALDAVMADPAVGQVLMTFDTPGGSVFGIEELGDHIRASRARKPIVGVADSVAASAGFWLLAQCSEVYVTPGGAVGSIGVYGAHEYIGNALSAAGVEITLISAGKYKVEGNPFEPLGAEARQEIQAQVDAYAGKFHQAVARGRGVPVARVRSGMGEGRMVMADAAVRAGMVDGVKSFDEVLAHMRRSGGTSRTAQARAPGSDRASAQAHAQALLQSLML